MRMMRNLGVCLLLTSVLIVSGLGVAGSQPDRQGGRTSNGPPSEHAALTKDLHLLGEIWEKKITLEFLADKRSADFLTGLLADFSPRLRGNFTANITGAYRQEFLANYAAKIAEVTDQIYDRLKDHHGLDPLVSEVLKNSPFPDDLALAPLVKKLQERRGFQANQGPDPATRAANQKQADYWSEVVNVMRNHAERDRFPVMQAKYAGKPVTEFPIHWYDDAQHSNTAYETEGANPAPPAPGLKRKPWTVLVYLAADNNLEESGLDDVNEMENVGSSDQVNVVVQVDRLRSGKGNTITDGNWTGTRRYYVTKDGDQKKIGSQMVMNLKEADMGDKQTMAEFLSWGVKTYPADHVAVVIWNHGGAWKGLGTDQQSGNRMTLKETAWALREGQQTLREVLGPKARFDILDFDACLMGTIEVACELQDVARYLVASEETEPGSGMPYADYLEPLVRNPQLTPLEFAKRMVATYVQSYSKGGSAYKTVQGQAVTKSAIDLDKIGPLVQLVHELGRALIKNHEAYTDALVFDSSHLAGIRRYGSEKVMVDLVDLATKLASIPKMPQEIREKCGKIIALMGYPVTKERLVQPVEIVSRKPGMVLWGYNGWRMPPEQLWPDGTTVFCSRLAITPLEKQTDGSFGLRLGPFQPVEDPALQRTVFVEQINYQISDLDGNLGEKQRVLQGKEYLIVSKFPAASPMVIEGHTQGQGDSRGLSIYFPPAFQFEIPYRSLKFSHDTLWDQFLGKFPVFRKWAKVLIVGQMVQNPQAFMAFRNALKANDVPFQVVWDPAVFGYQFKKILRLFAKDGVVITDSMSDSSFGQLAPSSEDFADYLSRGGRLIMAAQTVEGSNIHHEFLKNYFRFSYVDDEKDFGTLSCARAGGEPLALTLNGEDSAHTARDVTIMKTAKPGELFVTTADGAGAGIAIRHQAPEAEAPHAAVFLGFRFEAISGAQGRNAILKEMLSRLR